MTYKYTFTVCTATYNRARMLNKVFDSLYAQTYRDFEWLVIDDGSEDNTRDVIKLFQEKANFPIRYIYQRNAGKPEAINHGVKEALGRLFLPLDSDDTCVPEALERLNYHWEAIPLNQRDKYSAVTVLCKDERGTIIGNKFPQNVIDSDSIEIRAKYNVKGEKWGFHRTDILKKYPFPVFEGEKWIPMSTVWNSISLKYKTRYVNEMLRIYKISEDSITVSDMRVKNPKGTAYFYNETLKMPFSIKLKIKNAIQYVCYSLHANVKKIKIIENCYRPFIALITLIPGYILFKRHGRK